jgi:hypothetical protein
LGASGSKSGRGCGGEGGVERGRGGVRGAGVRGAAGGAAKRRRWRRAEGAG